MNVGFLVRPFCTVFLLKQDLECKMPRHLAEVEHKKQLAHDNSFKRKGSQGDGPIFTRS